MQRRDRTSTSRNSGQASPNPEGLEETVSDGFIAAFRNDRSSIQITAAISSGASGSPVLDECGQVIGIVSSIDKEGQNLSFAIAVETLKVAYLAEEGEQSATNQSQ